MDLDSFQEKVRAAFEKVSERLNQVDHVQRVRDVVRRGYHELGIKQIILHIGYTIGAMFSLWVMLTQSFFYTSTPTDAATPPKEK